MQSKTLQFYSKISPKRIFLNKSSHQTTSPLPPMLLQNPMWGENQRLSFVWYRRLILFLTFSLSCNFVSVIASNFKGTLAHALKRRTNLLEICGVLIIYYLLHLNNCMCSCIKVWIRSYIIMQVYVAYIQV